MPQGFNLVKGGGDGARLAAGSTYKGITHGGRAIESQQAS